MRGVVFFLFLFLTGTSCLGATGQSQNNTTAAYQRPKTHLPNPKYRDRISKLFNSKMYNDPYIMSQILNNSEDFKKKSEEKKSQQSVNLSAVLSKKDSGHLQDKASLENVKTASQEKQAQINEKVFKDPQGAYVDMIMNQEVVSLNQSDMQDLGGINKQPLSDFLMMVTESGPDIGAKEVPVNLK